ncbi:hypothetical protein OV208_25280 [Corallococcus sp. bb12-1]|uniref:hypothetical protein n=1 Tax=Corallococcus sp. bb12-1 TaxID=2996784 RepID=UPI002270F8DF|nr:hypothetical protein [Corallococcus sp. bb12-1]MCY1044655.1 hypothetical protein [Corallococcus sp. bb12-1]
MKRAACSEEVPHAHAPRYERLEAIEDLLDDRHLVMSSHNWTLSSFTRYDETSLYLDSEELGARLEERFRALWTEKAEREAAAASPMAAESAVAEP